MTQTLQTGPGLSAGHLLPAPAQAKYGTGSFPLSALTIYTAPDAPAAVKFALQDLERIVRESTGKSVNGVQRMGTAKFSYAVKKPGFEVPAAGEKGGEREAYTLSIDKTKGVRVDANTSAGLYYAVQTIRQLIQGKGPQARLPELELEDRPALAYRGVMMDFAHGGLLTVAEIKRQIDFLARWKANQYYFYNEISIEMEGYAGMNHKASYTQTEIREIVAYGRERHMDVIPFVAFYGHLHDLLKQETYAGMGIGKYGEELDPRNPKVQRTLRDWIRQYATMFSSPFVHVGFDETWETNRISKEVDSNVHSEQLWLQHLDFVQKEWAKYGKTVLAWTDMNNYYPDIMGRIPAGVIPVIWEYSPDTTAIHQYLDPVLKEKKPFFIQPAVSGWGHIYPNTDYTYENIDLCLKAGMRNETLGFITSVWTDAVEPFVRPSWMFMAYGCIGAWQGTSPDRPTFASVYTGLLYPTAHEEIENGMAAMASTIDELSKVLGKNTSNLPGGTIIESWSNPFSPYYLGLTRTHTEELRKARLLTEQAITELVLASKKAAPADTAFVNSLLVSARLLHYTCSRFLLAKAICDRWNDAMLGKHKNDFVYYDIAYICHGLIQDVMDEGGGIRDAYAASWLSESMPYRLNTMLGRFDVEYGLWQKLLLKVLDYRIQHEREHVADKSFEDLFRPDF